MLDFQALDPAESVDAIVAVEVVVVDYLEPSAHVRRAVGVVVLPPS